MTDARRFQASVEDCEDSDGEVVFRSPNAGGQANVARKRSQTSDLGTNERQPEKVSIDLASDSGYSSHTAATVSSADSAQSTKSQSPPVVRATAAVPPSPSTRRPTIVQQRTDSNYNGSPRKPLSRTGSKSGRPRGDTVEDCKDPNCNKCVQQSRSRGRRPHPSPLDSAIDINYPPFDVRSQRSDPAQYPPPSPRATRQQPSYFHGSAVVQPATTARRRSSSTSRARPVSYHGDPQQGYWIPGMPYPTPPQERGPPPSMSAHFNAPSQIAPYTMMGSTPPNNFYPPGPPHPLQTSPPYDSSRPPLTHNNSAYSTRRPSSQYGQPLIQQSFQTNTNMSARGPAPSARYDNNTRALQSSAFDSESSEDDDYSEEEGDRALMPPPPRTKSSNQRRPSLHRRPHTETLSNRLTQSQTLPDRERSSRTSRPSTTNTSRASSIRPSLIQQQKSASYDNPGNARIIVESSSARARRRQSYMGHEQEYELQAKHRNSGIYRGEKAAYRDEPPAPVSRRRQTESDGRRREDIVDKAREAERYQQRMRGGDVVPELTEQVRKAARRSSRVPSGASESGSTRSKNSDKVSSVSRSNRTTVTDSANGDIRLRIDGSTGINLQLNGDMEGRIISLNPADDGMAEIVIGSSRGNENVYKSEKGSLSGRKALPASSSRRDAEESSVRSRTSRNGRDEERRSFFRTR